MKRVSIGVVVTGLVCTIAAFVIHGKFFSRDATAGPKSSVGKNVAAQNRVSYDQIDHTAWDALLQKYVNQNGMVNYAAWKATAADQQQLQKYLQTLSAADTTARASKEGKLAFWINAYNAMTVHGMLQHYPTTSIRNHTAKVFGYNIWKDLLITVSGAKYSLEDIEHKVLRKMGEPKIHFGIVCASIGCPRLMNKAFTAQNVKQQLSANAVYFFAQKQHFQYNANNQKIALSSILKWFGEDFGRNQAEQLKAIAPYLPDQASKQLALSGRAQVSFLNYNWNINEQKNRRTARRQ